MNSATAGLDVVLLDRYALAAMASGWTLAGVRQSGRDPAELPLARAAVEIWGTLAERLDAPTHYRRHGNLRIAHSEADMASLTAMVAEQSAAGLPISLLHGADAVRAIAPAVAPEIAGASFCPSDGHADPKATVTRPLIDAAIRAGALHPVRRTRPLDRPQRRPRHRRHLRTSSTSRGRPRGPGRWYLRQRTARTARPARSAGGLHGDRAAQHAATSVARAGDRRGRRRLRRPPGSHRPVPLHQRHRALARPDAAITAAPRDPAGAQHRRDHPDISAASSRRSTTPRWTRSGLA